MSGSDSGKVISTIATQVTPISKTAAAGFALQNATPTILTFTAPNDGNLHAYTLVAALNVTVLEVGGAVQLAYTANTHTFTPAVFASALAVGFYAFTLAFISDPGQSVFLTQTAALTSGAAALFAAFSGG